MNGLDKNLETILNKLVVLIANGQFEEQETHIVEIKPTPPDTGSWRQIHKSINAFLNTQGGVVIIGIRENKNLKRYEYDGYDPNIENKIKDIQNQYKDRGNNPIDDINGRISGKIFDLACGRVYLIQVEPLPADAKFCFYNKEAYKREITGDHPLTEAEIDRQEEYKEELHSAREIQPVAGTSIEDIDLDKLNDYIQTTNQPVKIETIKPDIESAKNFLSRKKFLVENQVTTLGMLVCGKNPGDHLGFRCHVHGYVDLINPQISAIVKDKKDIIGNILTLLDEANQYVMRNIQVGIGAEQGGVAMPEYPQELIRETLNNALAHRDYKINRQIIVAITPGKQIKISNPGCFRQNLLLDFPNDPAPIRRIIPEAKPRNPKLADILRVYRKWEGRGIGMATLLNICLRDQIDLPVYRLKNEEVELTLKPGKLVDEYMEGLFKSMDKYIQDKLSGAELTLEQKRILTYLIKAEWATAYWGYTIALTPDNNHYNELAFLERVGLIQKHPKSDPSRPIYIADRNLIKKDYREELLQLLGEQYSKFNTFDQKVLDVVYRRNRFSSRPAASAKQISQLMWLEGGNKQDIPGFDSHYRKVRNAVVSMTREQVLIKLGKFEYMINRRFRDIPNQGKLFEE